MDETKEKRAPLCFVEVIDVPLSSGSEVIETMVEAAYVRIQEDCEEGGYIPLSAQQTVHTYTEYKDGNPLCERIVFVLTAQIVTQEELQRRQRLAQIGGGGNQNGPRRG